MKKLLFFLSLCLSFLGFSQVPSYVPTAGLVAFYPFSGNTTDVSGNGNNGTIIGAITPSLDRFGNTNSSYSFTGNGHVQLPSINLPSFTINAWVKRLPTATGSSVVCKHYSSSLNSSYLLFSQSAADNYCTPNIYYTSTSNVPASINATGSSWCDNNWHMLTGVLSSTSLKIYFDGVLITSHAGATAKSTSFNTLIGAQYSNSGVPGNQDFGDIDDVGFWNLALSDCEILNLYTAGNPSVSLFNDIDQNCLLNNETSVPGVNIILQPGNFVSSTQPSGVAVFPSLPDGSYTVTVDTTNLNWVPSCGLSQTFQVVNGSADCINFGMLNNNPCTDPDVSIYAPFLRPCLPNQMIYVQACNQMSATGVLNASYVDVELDPLMTVTASSIPYTLQSPNVYRYQTGNLNPGQCANFSISTTIGSPAVGCASLLGQTLCMDARLYPVESCVLDTVPSNPPSGSGGTLNGFPQPCTLPWDQSSLSVDGWCANDSIYFTITNTGEPGGGDMECYSPMWITVDGVVTYTDSIMIAGGETMTLAFPGDGATWILNAAQHPLHPGNSNPNAHVEACGDLSNWTPDLVNDFPQDDADPVVDIYCGIVTGSYDPNDKTGYPNGVTDQYYIQPNQQLQYVIRFQNTGTDTAFTVVIRDTLDIDLNIFTVTPGVSSHNYEFRMYGPRVLEWTFNNILLPDSTTNEPESNGFVTFHVEQVPDLAPGTEITNDADIYFDFNEPITTNTTMHRIYEGFVAVATLEEIIKETSGLTVYPNPSNGQFTLVMDQETGAGNYSLYDQQGRIVKTGLLTGKKTNIDLNLNGGMYYLMVGSKVTKVQLVR
jgi:uncharacterized repeat protein (TIGR01451 family)